MSSQKDAESRNFHTKDSRGSRSRGFGSKVLGLLSFCIFLAVGLMVAQVHFSDVLEAQQEPAKSDAAAPAAAAPVTPAAAGGETLKAYEDLSLNQGVWEGGQAALWDFDIIDHFRIFGHKERVRGYKPEQPIKFSHVTHVQKNKMECQFCHWNVAKAAYATIPEVETCFGCHKIVRGSTDEQKQEIEKLLSYGKEENFVLSPDRPIPWKKVHVMPDFVKFNHKRHVKAGVGCHECHGQIPKMEVVERVSSMKMGWCVSCHRDKGASIDCYVCHR